MFDVEKRWWLMESFRGFVVDVICIFKFNNFVIIIVECLKVFE